MPNQLLTAAIDQAARNEDLSAAQASAVLLEIMEGRASESTKTKTSDSSETFKTAARRL